MNRMLTLLQFILMHLDFLEQFNKIVFSIAFTTKVLE